LVDFDCRALGVGDEDVNGIACTGGEMAGACVGSAVAGTSGNCVVAAVAAGFCALVR